MNILDERKLRKSYHIGTLSLENAGASWEYRPDLSPQSSVASRRNAGTHGPYLPAPSNPTHLL